MVKEGHEVSEDFLCSLVPRCIDAFGQEVAIILARSLLWASFELTIHVKEREVNVIPSGLRTNILAAWAAASPGRGVGVQDNPIEKVGLLVSQRMDQLDIVPTNVCNDDENNGGGVGGGGQEAVENLGSQIFHLQQIVGDMRNEVNSLFFSLKRHISTVNTNVRRIALVPAARGSSEPTTQAPRVRLSKCPRDLFVLWREWEQGISGAKPAKQFTNTERGANKFTFLRRRVFWDCVEEMVRRGQTSDVAIDSIYRVYGWSKSVTKILCEMGKDKRSGVRRV